MLKDECCDYSICFKTRISWVLTWNSIIPVDTGKTPNFYSSRKQNTEHMAFFNKSGQDHRCSKFQLTIQMEQGIWVRKCYRYPEYQFWKFLFTWKNNQNMSPTVFQKFWKIFGMGILTFVFKNSFQSFHIHYLQFEKYKTQQETSKNGINIWDCMAN